MNSCVNCLFLISLCGYVVAAPVTSKCGNNEARNGGSGASGENDVLGSGSGASTGHASGAATAVALDCEAAIATVTTGSIGMGGGGSLDLATVLGNISGAFGGGIGGGVGSAEAHGSITNAEINTGGTSGGHGEEISADGRKK